MDTTSTKPPLTPYPKRLLRIRDVALLTTLSKSCLNLWVAQGRFPKPIAISSTVKVWRATDIDEWISNLQQREQTGNKDKFSSLAEQQSACGSKTREAA